MTITTFHRLVILGTLWTACVVALGAWTRLADAGLGCPDWPGCYGHLIFPDTQQEIAAANAKFPDTPFERSLAIPEVTHRGFAGGLGLLIFALAFAALRTPKASRHNYGGHLAPAMAVLVVIQALFGYWTVSYKLLPQTVTLHLLLGHTLFVLFALLLQRTGQAVAMQASNNVHSETQRLSSDTAVSHPQSGRQTGTQHQIPGESKVAIQILRPLAAIAMLAVVCQIALGGWLSANYAALACPDFPTCGGQWNPENADYSAGFTLPAFDDTSFLGGVFTHPARVAIHFSHRIGAVIVLLVVGLLAWKLYQRGLQKHAAILSCLLLLQLALGIANVVLQLPLTIAVLHNLGGMLLLTCLVLVVSNKSV